MSAHINNNNHLAYPKVTLEWPQAIHSSQVCKTFQITHFFPNHSLYQFLNSQPKESALEVTPNAWRPFCSSLSRWTKRWQKVWASIAPNHNWKGLILHASIKSPKVRAKHQRIPHFFMRWYQIDIKCLKCINRHWIGMEGFTPDIKIKGKI